MSILNRKRKEMSDDPEDSPKKRTNGTSHDNSKRQEKSSDKLIKEANDLDVKEFESLYLEPNALQSSVKSPMVNAKLSLKASADLTADESSSCFNLIESTSRRDYEASASFGWHPKRKKREMKESEMRYLLVRPSSENTDSAVSGFLSFMLTHDSVPSVPVVYIYEIHLSETLRGCGLGAHLMHMAEDIGQRVGVEKIMLTCFLTNVKALAFYRKRGYDTDECSPEDRLTRKKVIKTDYIIMSKPVVKVKADQT